MQQQHRDPECRILCNQECRKPSVKSVIPHPAQDEQIKWVEPTVMTESTASFAVLFVAPRTEVEDLREHEK